MVERFTKEKILALNPHIDKEELELIQRMLNKIRVQEGRKHRYSLVPPFARPRVTVGEGDNIDPRTIVLHYSKK